MSLSDVSRTASAPMVAVALRPPRSFDAASRRVLDYLTAARPMGMWAVTRVVDGQQVMLHVESPAYGVTAGAAFPYDVSMCRPMVAGVAPRIAPDVRAVPEYAAAADTAPITVGAYLGTPIVRPDGTLFGTVCGYDPQRQPDSLYGMQPLLDLLSDLLSSVLESDSAATATARALETSQREADTDALTGVSNRRGWDRFLAAEEERYRRFGDPACVIVMDLDGLKEINDARGHAAGDRYIRLAAITLQDTVREGDFLARLGGDEFGIVAVGASPEVASDLAARLEAALERVGAAGSTGHAPYSVVTGFPGAWQGADAAMYERKRQRRAVRI